MLAKRREEMRGRRKFIAEEVGVEFSSQEVQQSKEEIKPGPLGRRQGRGWNTTGQSNRAPKRTFSSFH